MDTDNPPPSKQAVAFGLSLAVCSLLNATLVIAKETSKTVSDAMQRLTGHHWVTHAALILIVYLTVGWGVSKTRAGSARRISAHHLVNTILGGVIGGVVIIFGFYIVAG